MYNIKWVGNTWTWPEECLHGWPEFGEWMNVSPTSRPLCLTVSLWLVCRNAYYVVVLVIAGWLS